MPTKEWSKIWHNAHLDVDLMQAFYVNHAYPRHSHDYYVICLIEQGLQSFSHSGARQFTPAGGLILINPGEVHTGESASQQGFKMRSIYPTISHMQTIASELNGNLSELPFFPHVRVDDRSDRDRFLALHNTLSQDASDLACESIFTWTLAQLIKRHGGLHLSEQRLGKEHKAIQMARRRIEDCYSEGIGLTELASYVSLSPYYLIRAFRSEVGMPPHAYLASVRIRQAQRLIEAGQGLAQVAAEVGFSSQAHLSQQFKQIIGVTPGQYAQEFR